MVDEGPCRAESGREKAAAESEPRIGFTLICLRVVAPSLSTSHEGNKQWPVLLHVCSDAKAALIKPALARSMDRGFHSHRLVCSARRVRHWTASRLLPHPPSTSHHSLCSLHSRPYPPPCPISTLMPCCEEPSSPWSEVETPSPKWSPNCFRPMLICLNSEPSPSESRSLHFAALQTSCLGCGCRRCHPNCCLRSCMPVRRLVQLGRS